VFIFLKPRREVNDSFNVEIIDLLEYEILANVGTSSECSQVGIVSRRWIGHTAWTSRVNMAQVERQDLNLIHGEVVVVVQDEIAARTTGALDARVRAQKEIEHVFGDEVSIDHCARRNVFRLAFLVLLIYREKACVVSLLNNDERDGRLVT